MVFNEVFSGGGEVTIPNDSYNGTSQNKTLNEFNANVVSTAISVGTHFSFCGPYLLINYYYNLQLLNTSYGHLIGSRAALVVRKLPAKAGDA